MSAGAIAAGLLAGTLGLMELFNASRKAPCLRAAGWILVLFGFDAASGMLAYALLLEILDGLTWFVGAWPVLVAGLCGPAILRSQLALLGSGQESSYHGPAHRFRRVQRYIERRIDELNAAAQSHWVAAKVMPYVSKLSLDELELRVTNYLKALEVVSDVERADILQYVRSTLTDANLDDASKCRAVVQKLIDGDCQQCVRGLVRRGRELA